jgi:hypothetical protein
VRINMKNKPLLVRADMGDQTAARGDRNVNGLKKAE